MRSSPTIENNTAHGFKLSRLAQAALTNGVVFARPLPNPTPQAACQIAEHNAARVFKLSPLAQSALTNGVVFARPLPNPTPQAMVSSPASQTTSPVSQSALSISQSTSLASQNVSPSQSILLASPDAFTASQSVSPASENVSSISPADSNDSKEREEFSHGRRFALTFDSPALILPHSVVSSTNAQHSHNRSVLFPQNSMAEPATKYKVRQYSSASPVPNGSVNTPSRESISDMLASARSMVSSTTTTSTSTSYSKAIATTPSNPEGSFTARAPIKASDAIIQSPRISTQTSAFSPAPPTSAPQAESVKKRLMKHYRRLDPNAVAAMVAMSNIPEDTSTAELMVIPALNFPHEDAFFPTLRTSLANIRVPRQGESRPHMKVNPVIAAHSTSSAP